MLPNISGFKEGKAKISAGLRDFHSKGESMWREISDRVYAADRTQVQFP